MIAIGTLCFLSVFTQGSPKILLASYSCLGFLILVNLSCVHFVHFGLLEFPHLGLRFVCGE